METINISLQSLNIVSMAVPLIMIVFGISLICINIFTKNLSVEFYGVICILAILLSFAVLFGCGFNLKGFFNTIYTDGIAFLSQIIILFASVLFIGILFEKGNFLSIKQKSILHLFYLFHLGFVLL